MSFRIISLCAAGGLLAVLPIAPSSADTAAPGWLTEVNQVRAESGLNPVTQETSSLPGMQAHINYLIHDKRWQTGAYADQHDENPAAPDFTDAGKAAGQTSVIAFGTRNDAAALDSWLAAPIHEADLLKPELTTVGFYRDPSSGDAMLFTDGGLAGTNQVVLAPGNGGTTHLTRFGGENPDPTKSCSASFQRNPGLPILAILPTAPVSTSSATLRHGDTQVPVCVLDQNNFNASTDPIYGPTAAQYFANGLVLVIPQVPLVPGDYTVALTPGGQAPIAWSFHSVPKAMPPGLGYDALCSYTNPVYASGQIQVGISNPLDTTHPTTYAVGVNGTTKRITIADGASKTTPAFTRLRVGTYSATVIGNDQTSGTERIAVSACPAWAAVRPLPGGSYSAAKHRITQPISNQRNSTTVTLKVVRSGMSTLSFRLPAKGKATLVIGVHPHGRTNLSYQIGNHILARVTLSAP